MVVQTATRTMTYQQAITEALQIAMREDPTVILLGEDIAGGAMVDHLINDDAWGGPMGVTKGLVQEFGRNRVLDTPITEAGFIGAAVGAAATGLRPVAELMFVDFFGCCMDQIYDQGAKFRYMFGGKAKCPVTIRTQIGAGVSAAGQHSGCHYSVFTHMPGIKCVIPSTPADAKGLLLSAIRDDDLVMFFENKVLYGTKGEVPVGNEGIPLGVADIKREGDDVTVVAISRMVQQALAAAETLAAEGIDAEGIDPRTLSPLDDETILNSVAKTHRLVIVDEDNPRCSAATDIAAMVADRGFDTLDAPIKLVTAPHTPVPFSPPLEQFYVPSPERIIETVREIV
ncbi:MAG TPA: alpha-ketoacid dehydrogenase subunit beta [Thermomicrobiales bacterium]|nr:alpha-ketoacid dehydrogenase subunit beta [Thermomicrobiales bacterium]